MNKPVEVSPLGIADSFFTDLLQWGFEVFPVNTKKLVGLSHKSKVLIEITKIILILV